MTQALTIIGPGGSPLPALYAPNAPAAKRTLEFFTAHIRNPQRAPTLHINILATHLEHRPDGGQTPRHFG